MKCPYRKQTRQKGKDLFNCVEEEHYMECYGKECPHYEDFYNLCKRAEGEYFHATHLGGNK